MQELTRLSINEFRHRYTGSSLNANSLTLESGINVAPGKFGKKNKRSPIYTLYLCYLNRLYRVQSKAVVPGKKSKN